MNRYDFMNEFKSYALISMLKKTDKQKFREIEDKYLSYLYTNLRMSFTDILKIYKTQHKTIKDAVLKNSPQKLRSKIESIRLASNKKRAAWANPESGYNNYGNGGNINNRNKVKKEMQ